MPETQANETTLCINCQHDGGMDKGCLSPEAPCTDFVMGTKQQRELNIAGKCLYFKK